MAAEQPEAEMRPVTATIRPVRSVPCHSNYSVSLAVRMSDAATGQTGAEARTTKKTEAKE